MARDIPWRAHFALQQELPENLEASPVRHAQTLARSYFQGHRDATTMQLGSGCVSGGGGYVLSGGRVQSTVVV